MIYNSYVTRPVAKFPRQSENHEMDEQLTTCSVIGCNNVASITDQDHGKFWLYRVDLCATCYEKLPVNDGSIRLDPIRIRIEPVRGMSKPKRRL